jgi:hypothetical protein
MDFWRRYSNLVKSYQLSHNLRTILICCAWDATDLASTYNNLDHSYPGHAIILCVDYELKQWLSRDNVMNSFVLFVAGTPEERSHFVTLLHGCLLQIAHVEIAGCASNPSSAAGEVRVRYFESNGNETQAVIKFRETSRRGSCEISYECRSRLKALLDEIAALL